MSSANKSGGFGGAASADQHWLIRPFLGPKKSEVIDAASIVAAKCIDALKPPVMLRGQMCVLGISVGIALGDGDSAAD